MESQTFKGSSPSGSSEREASSKTDRQVSWVEEPKKKVQRQEDSRIYVPSTEDSVVSTGFATVTEEAASKEDMRLVFSSVTEGVTSETD
jgi:hypothetical protein